MIDGSRSTLAGIWLVAVFSLSFWVASIASVRAASGSEPVIVLIVEAPWATPNQSAALMARFRDEIARTGRFTMIDADLLERTSAEQGFGGAQRCDNPRCYQALSAAIGAKWIIRPAILQQGDFWTLSAQVINVGNTTTVWPVSVPQQSTTFADVLEIGLARLAQLAAGIADTPGGAPAPNPRSAKMWLDKGFALRQPDGQFQQPDLAAYYFSKAVEAEPNNTLAHSVRAFVYMQLQEYQEAMRDYDQAIRLDPRSAEFYMGRGKANRALQRIPAACADLRKACELGLADACPLVKKGSGC
jgi:tetratricopeptide (TPR) repeat protein